jgi:hypothetical protein
MNHRSAVLVALCILSFMLIFPMASPAASLTGKVMYNEQPVSNVTHKPAAFWVRDEVNMNSVPFTFTYDTLTAEYTISGLPAGVFGVQVWIQDAVPTGFYPGNYYGWNTPILVPAEGDIVKKNLAITKLIHLTTPADNSLPQNLPPPFDEYLAGSITFKWVPINEAATYELYIDEYQSWPYQYIGLIHHSVNNQTSVAISLNRNLEGHHYQFHLYAKNSSGVYIGQLMIVYGELGHGWDYRFVLVTRPESITQAIVNLEDTAFTNNAAQRKNALSNKLDEIQVLIDQGYYQQALNKLENDIRSKMDGCYGGNPKNDWITDCAAQGQLLALVDDLIAYLQSIL